MFYWVFLHLWGFPDSSVGKESACSAGDPGSMPGSGRSTGEGTGYPLQNSWASLVAQLVKSLSTRRETWVGKIPWRRERPTPVFRPGEFRGLYSPWGRRVGHDWVTFTSIQPNTELEYLGDSGMTCTSLVLALHFQFILDFKESV